jgi:hypothetical protein
LFRRFLAVVTIGVLTTLISIPSYSDDVQINLDPSTPYVDVPVTVTEPVDATVQTVTGTPGPGFIDSWIEIWQDTTRLAFNDDGAHSATNYLASIINIPLLAGEYFIRATSYAYMCCNALPTGSYLLSTNLIVVTPTPTLEPSPSPSVTEEIVPSPTPSPSETSTVQPSPEPSPTPSETQSQPESLPGPDNSQPVQPSQESLPVVPTVEPQVSVVPVEPSVSAQPDEMLTSISSPSSEPSLQPEVFSPTNEVELNIGFLEISLPPALSEAVLLVSEAITDSLEAVSNLGSEFTPSERKQAQQVILGAIIVSQLANPRRVK